MASINYSLNLVKDLRLWRYYGIASMVSTPFFFPTYTCMHSQACDASHAMGAQFGTHLIGGFKVLRTYDRASGLRWRHRSCFRKRECELDGVFQNVNDKVLTRQCPCLRAFDSWSVCGILEDSTASDRNRGTHEFTQVRPPEGKDLHPAFLILYCLYNWSYYNGAQMGSGYGRKRDGVWQGYS
jgi:hypothetical protein